MSPKAFKAGLVGQTLAKQVKIFFQLVLADLISLASLAGFDWHADIHPLPLAAFLTTDIDVHKLSALNLDCSGFVDVNQVSLIAYMTPKEAASACR
jgi:hypothetical protein